ncbi:hypothetical protein GYMLUDRAFT_553956 [Collybiopsis luxurians FD-317 M1]|uniref:Uncharacterized protein n=1 Tax=Collybiopsis luxurians FD-317 M1 TaxID=944289 RepID=A0A0D0BEM5_9AGAR|nr:hypothetical protein GYMLUDRAFT_553956 [Collybiopsis luxurians FD-317 M1]
MNIKECTNAILFLKYPHLSHHRESTVVVLKMRRAAAKAKKLFKKDKNQTHSPAASRPSTPDPESGTVLQMPSINQSTTGSGAIIDTLETALVVLKEVSAVFTPLQAAVGGVVECIHIYKQISGAARQRWHGSI